MFDRDFAIGFEGALFISHNARLPMTVFQNDKHNTLQIQRDNTKQMYCPIPHNEGRQGPKGH